ncbi:MAG: tetratricopeptide repeat protein [Planctomycetaceae bacterium]|nr:tetratricopeptide repeat protein [Planctomycetaceae bacterium]
MIGATVGLVFALIVILMLPSFEVYNHFTNGLQAISRDRFEEAVQDFTEGLGRVDSAGVPFGRPVVTKIALRVFRGRCLYQLGKYEESLDDFDMMGQLIVEREGKESGQRQTWKAAVYAKMGEFESAVRELSTAIEEDRENSRLLLRRADANYQLGDYESAIHDFDSYLNTDAPDDLERIFARFYRALAHKQLNEDEVVTTDLEAIRSGSWHPYWLSVDVNTLSDPEVVAAWRKSEIYIRDL